MSYVMKMDARYYHNTITIAEITIENVTAVTSELIMQICSGKILIFVAMKNNSLEESVVRSSAGEVMQNMRFYGNVEFNLAISSSRDTRRISTVKL